MRRFVMRAAIALLCWFPVSVSGQYYDWGRSPQGMLWKQAKTGFGKIVYPDYYSGNAARMANYLDTIRPWISYGYDHGPLRLPVVMHTENFVSNGLVLWAPLRMEIEAIAPPAPFAEPWLKQLATHEYRHAVQYGNLYRRCMKGIGWIVGQQAGLVSSALVPVWLLEGDAVMAETQMASFGRALQPSFTIEMRAYLTEGKKKFPLDKWFCGSYKDFMPDHYQFGYQLTAWSRERYGDDIWSRVMDYGARRPYTILTTKWALKRYYRTSVDEIARNTLDDLTRFWLSQPLVENSARIVPTPVTSYTVYEAPMRLDDTTLLALKKDMDRTSRVVAVDLRTNREKKLFSTGNIHTSPVWRDSVLYWSEYRSSTLWEQRVLSRICRYDLRTGKRSVARDRGSAALYPVPLPGGRLATVSYDYTGRYRLDLGDGELFPFPEDMTVHGLAYDDRTGTMAFIALDDRGMWIGRIDLVSGRIEPVTRPSRVSVYNLRAGAGCLSFNSIASGKDEIHLYDLRKKEEYRLSRSRYGSVAPAAPDDRGELFFTTYSLDGYRLSHQRIDVDSLVVVPYRELPENTVNPPRRKWDVMNIDTVTVSSGFQEGTPVRRFRKGLRLFDVHSWAPWDFNPFHIADENRIDITFGATVMSQDLLSSTTGYLAYGYAGGRGSRWRGAINYAGLAPRFSLSFDYGGGNQLVYGDRSAVSGDLKRYFQLTLYASLPMTLSSGHRIRTLTPFAELRHMNALIVRPSGYDKGYQRLVTGLTYTDNVRMAVRDLLPRWGYALRFTTVNAPFRDGFGRLYSLFGRLYMPGAARHHSLMLRGNLQRQSDSDYNFFYKELYPRGAVYDRMGTHYAALSADYQLPVWYPDGGISSILYFSRVRMNLYYDFARFREVAKGERGPVFGMRSVSSFGGEIILDMHPLRIPSKVTTVGFYIFRPDDRRGVVTGLNLSLPI